MNTSSKVLNPYNNVKYENICIANVGLKNFEVYL